MTLKTATKIAIIAISINFLLSLALQLFTRADSEMFYTIVGILGLATLHVPLIIFFGVLYHKQK
ncbi:MAG: hypothetical protein QOF02_2830 [Blastocatellia bacterium]|jgi:hypothetical protein|nr:hypothetical protein [Blastocatellia bacterium]